MFFLTRTCCFVGIALTLLNGIPQAQEAMEAAETLVNEQTTTPSVSVSTDTALEEKLRAIVAKLSLRQKVMQMHTMGYPGITLGEEMKTLIEEDCIGGFFLQVLSNFTFPEECGALTSTLQQCALQSTHGVPLFLAMDMEGGVAAPLHYMLGATPTPGNMALGASGREQDAYAAYNAIGSEMRLCGANLNYAPAVDVLTEPKNPDYTVRSFSGSTAINAVMAQGAVRGLQEANVIACVKHFPGLACYAEDTHRAAPHITWDEATLWKDDFAHWRAAITAGADMIMTCHAYVDVWDIEYPVTLSKKILQGVLREKLQYNGVILTDSMGMGAIGKNWESGEAAVLAVKAGCDRILQVSRDLDGLRTRVDAIMAAVQRGEIPESQIDASVLRTLRLKAKYGLFTNPLAASPHAIATGMGSPARVAANKRAALNGVVLLRQEAGVLPLPKEGKKILVICPPSSITRAGKGKEVMPLGYTLGYKVQEKVADATEVFVDTVPTGHQVAYALRKAQEAEIIVVGQLLAIQSPSQVDFLHQVLALDKPVIIINMGVASDIALFPEAKTVLAANSPAPISISAAVDVLFGEAQPGGKLPMSAGKNYPIGFESQQIR